MVDVTGQPGRTNCSPFVLDKFLEALGSQLDDGNYMIELYIAYVIHVHNILFKLAHFGLNPDSCILSEGQFLTSKK